MNLLYSIPNKEQFLKWKVSVLSIFQNSKIVNIKFLIIIDNNSIAKQIYKFFNEFKLPYKIDIFNIIKNNSVVNKKSVPKHFYKNGMIWWILAPYIFCEDGFIILDNDTIFYTNLVELENIANKFYNTNNFFKGKHISDHYWVKINTERNECFGQYNDYKSNFVSTSVGIVNAKEIRKNYNWESFSNLTKSYFEKVYLTTKKWYCDESFVNIIYKDKIDSSLPFSYNFTYQHPLDQFADLFNHKINPNGFIFHFYNSAPNRAKGISINNLLFTNDKKFNKLINKIEVIMMERDKLYYSDSFNNYKKIIIDARHLLKSSNLNNILI